MGVFFKIAEYFFRSSEAVKPLHSFTPSAAESLGSTRTNE